MSDTPHSPLAEYHARTRHHFNAYAEGPGQLDWDAQPAPFRHYHGAPITPLPLCADDWERPFGELQQPRTPPAPVTLATLGAWLECSLALSAWKSWGPQRWALRCNPSSGNLHPVEAYVISAGLPELADGLHHYDPEHHQLEGRALRAPDGQRWLSLGLSSVMWREAWKYGERAFRYCQLDVGHALGALAYAARLLGWQIAPVAGSNLELAQLLGLARSSDFPPGRYAYTENEEAEILVSLHAPGLSTPSCAAQLDWLSIADWHGQPSIIDPQPGYRWPLIDQAAQASRALTDPVPSASPEHDDWPPLQQSPSPQGSAALMRQRRSAQRFDPRASLPASDFYRLLDACLPRQLAPFDAQEAAPGIQLLLFVQRVQDLPSGLYLLTRSPAGAALSSTLRALPAPPFQRLASHPGSRPTLPGALASLSLVHLATPRVAAFGTRAELPPGHRLDQRLFARHAGRFCPIDHAIRLPDTTA